MPTLRRFSGGLALPRLGLVAGSLLAASLVTGSCAGGDEGGAPEALAGGARAREIPRVRAATLVEREMVRVLETTSVLESEREIELFPRMAGVVIELAAEEGDSVRSGDVLARLDDRAEVLAVQEAEVALEQARQDAEDAELRSEEASAGVRGSQLAFDQSVRDHERDVKLFEGGEVAGLLARRDLEAGRLARDNAESELEQAKIALRLSELTKAMMRTALEGAELALERARLNLSYTRITAPFEGVIAERKIRVGDRVSTGEAAFTLTDAANLRAVFFRPQEELELFTGGGEAKNGDGPAQRLLEFTATAEAFPGRGFGGAVERISPSINPDSGQFRVTARIDPTSRPPTNRAGDVRLLPGMLVRMTIVTDRHEKAIVAPKRALRREGEALYVLRVEAESEGGGTVCRRVDVLEGFSDDENVELLPAGEERLAAGDRVIAVGSRDLESGDPVLVDELPGSEEEPGGTPENPSEGPR